MNDQQAHLRAKEILADALQLQPEERSAYVAEICASNAMLLAEVQSLLKFATSDHGALALDMPAGGAGGSRGDGPPSGPACQGLADDALRRKVEKLLAEQGHATPEIHVAFDTGALAALEHAIGDTDRQGTPAGLHPTATSGGDNANWPGTSRSSAVPRIAGYEIERVIGSGGMGTVYAAQQKKPRRTVAIKVMRPGVASPAALRRFEHEAQVLAHLRHPGIAQVFEADTFTAEGVELPFFVMEYVPDALTLTEYAEQKKLGIPERLTLFGQVCDAIHHGHQKGVIHRDIKPSNVLVDAQGCAKVIDFGVARSTDADLAVTTMQTDAGQLIGTLQYMSPEQVSLDCSDIDTRSDVYALGVVLYELLCVQRPYDLRGHAIHDASRIIRETRPTRPGGVDPRLRGDIETVILKALEKDRERRYPSANELQQDVLRCLRHEAIHARPPSLIYQLRVLTRRHRGLAYGVLTAWTILVVSSIVVSVLYLKTRSALDAESKQRRLAIEAKDDAETQRAIADREARVSNAINAFLQEDMLSAADPRERGREITVAEALDIAAQKVGSRFADQPDVEAPLRVTLGRTYGGLGKLDAALRELQLAVPLAERAYGLNHAETIRAYTQLAFVYRTRGEIAEAETQLQRVIELSSRTYGKLDRRTLQADGALALLYRDASRFDEAETLGKRVLEDRRRVFGAADPDTIVALNNLAYVYQSTGRLAEAEPLALEALEATKATNGADHPTTLTFMSTVAWLLMGQEKFAQAEELHRRALEGKMRVLGPDHADTVSGMHGLAECFRVQGRYAEAAELLDEAEAAAHRAWPADSWMISGVQAMYGDVLMRLERYDDAEPMLVKAIERLERTVGADHQLAQIAIGKLIELYEKTDRPDRALTWQQKKRPTSH